MTDRDEPNMQASSPNHGPAATEGQPDLTAFWEQVSDRMRKDIGETAWRSWIRPLHIQAIEAGELQLSTDNRLTRERVNASYIDRLRIHSNCLRADINRIDLVLADNPQRDPPPRFTDNPPVAREARPTHGLDPRFTFANFVVGKPNELAFAAARRVAESEVPDYNPLFLYGGVGLGKTHLMHAIAWEMRARYPQRKIAYLSAEKFMYRFVNALRHQDMMSFKEQFRSVDMLMIDDVQFIAGKDSTQEEFFHTFNTLHNADKQIVVTSDLPPKQLQDFEDRMRSRFEWGLITDIKPPELETRIAILRKKVAQEKLLVPDEVLEFIASRVTTNIRELEGALIRISAYAGLNKVPVELALAEVVLKDLIPDQAGPQITSSMIMAQTSQYFGISVDDLIGSSRSRTLVTARQIAMYLCRELTDLSLPRIGSSFGGRDHTTVMHAERKVRQLMTERRGIYNQVADLTTRIKTEARNS